MKKVLILAACLSALCSSAFAQAQKPKINFPDYKFTTIKEMPVTSVKNQKSSGTCWAFSTLSFVESEIIRINDIKDPEKYPDLSEFFVVSHSYSERADKYAMLDGALAFRVGSEADDVLHVIRDWGMVPNSEMTGMNYGTDLPKQAELDAVLKAYMDAILKNPNKTLTTAWKRGLDAILREYFGAYPEKFTVDGVEYTPESYRDSFNFNPDDYITINSFNHHPFYTWFPIEICDNWRWDEVYNVPIDEFMEILDYALDHGYTAAWGADVSEPGFTRDGLAILADVDLTNAGSDQAHWVGYGEAKDSGKKPKAGSKTNNVVEKEASQEQRQIEFMNKTMTDDHGMHIYGIAEDQWGQKYYLVKNSWGVTGKYDGIWYASVNFVKAQSIDIMIHRSALPEGFAEKHPNINR